MCTKLQLNVNLFPVICCLMEVNTFCGHTRLKMLVRSISKWKSFEKLRQAITNFSFQVFLSALHFGKYGLQPRV